MRLGETDRSIARSQQVGRRKVAEIHAMANEQNWLDASGLMPDDVLIAAHYRTSGVAAHAKLWKSTQNTSTVEAYRADVLDWHQKGIAVTTMR